MSSVVYLSVAAPSQMAADLTLAGVTVWEAISVSEVLYLCERESIDVVVIGADVDDPEVIEVQIRHATMRLQPSATAGDVLWELSHLLPMKRSEAIH